MYYKYIFIGIANISRQLYVLHLHSGLYVISYYFWTRNMKQVTYTKRVM